MGKHGAPDWYKYRRDSTTFPIEDLAELAVRLGSIVSFDRRGDVIYMDDFENGLVHLHTASSPPDAAVALAPTVAKTGGYAAKLTAPASVLHYVEISRVFPYPVLCKMGFETSFAFDSDLETYEQRITLYDGTTATLAGARYNYADKKIQIRTVTPAWTDIATSLDLYLAGFPFWTMKLVADFANGVYARLILNNHAYDLSDYAPHTQDSDTTPCLKVSARNVTVGGNNGVVYVDDIIVTQDEP